MEEGLITIQGGQPPQPDKYTSLATIKFIGGLQTQRSAFASIDTRYSTKFLGGKPDALIAGQNVEISNKLTLQRRPGLTAYGTANVPAPTAFFDWQLATTGDIILVLDTSTSGGDNHAAASGAVFNYSPTNSGIYFNKGITPNLPTQTTVALNVKQTNFFDVVNTLYCGNGTDRFKIIGPNLLAESNTFGTGAGTNFVIQAPWIDAQVFSLTGGQTDPLGGATASLLIYNTTGSTAYLRQQLVSSSPTANQTALNYTPIAYNTFTASIWLKNDGTHGITVDLNISDQSGSIATTTVVTTATWTKYQVTGTMLSTSTEVQFGLQNPTTTNNLYIYGAQLEVGGPATTTQITTTHPQGVYLWGIQAPPSAPNAIVASNVVGAAWQPNHAYSTAIYAVTQVASGTGVYTGTFPNGGSNNLAGLSIQIAGFTNTVNNGTFTISASTTTTITTNNSNSQVQSGQTATATISLALTSVTAAQGSATYFGSNIFGGGGNGLVGYAVTIAGFTNATNNGTFYVSGSTGVSLTVLNSAAITETASGSPTALVLGQAVTDSNGNLEVAIASGTSGGNQPTWSASTGGQTSDGTNAFHNIQYNSGSANALTVAVAFSANVTVGDTLLGFVASNNSTGVSFTVTDSLNGGSWTQVSSSPVFSGPFAVAMFWYQSTAAGACTVTATQTGSGTGIWLGIVETSQMASVDGTSSNHAASVASGTNSFLTGQVTTTTTHDLFISFCMVVAGNSNQNTTLTAPSLPAPGFQSFITATDVSVPQGYMWIEAAFQYLTSAQTISPQWTVTFGAGGSREVGITCAFIAQSTATLIWQNYGSIGLTAAVGFNYYYAFMNSQTGHVSNVSPISSGTGALAGVSVTVTGVGMQILPSGGYSQDPQVDTIALYRNTDGGSSWYQLATFANPGTTTSAGTWTFSDTTPSTSLNTAIYAPIDLLNSVPPAGILNMEWFAGRLWGSVQNILYYSTSSDNASLFSVVQNGVASESWLPTNYIPFNAQITRSIAVGNGLLVFTTTDTWMVTGQNLLQGGFNPVRVMAYHGLRSYNAANLDGNTIWLYTSDRQMLQISPNSGSVEVGYPLGDTFETSLSPVTAYVARHVSGSRDNAMYIADGSTGWYRLNPNQQGASMSGEQTPVWSPKADFTASIGGIGAIASMEVSAGTIYLLVGQTAAGPVLRRNLSTFSDNGTPYSWTATIGSILLATAGKLAEVESITTEMNNTGGSAANQCTVGVLLDEISGTFESLPLGVYDPPQLNPTPSNSSVLSSRFYLSQGNITPTCRHVQIQLTGEVLSGTPVSTQDEILAITIRGCIVPEQI